MKQTSIEWLEKICNDRGYHLMLEYFEQAKEMHKQEIIDAWDNGFDNGNYYGKYNENCEINCGEQYYNETYNK